MKILLVSTRGHNPGDDFIRLGLEYLLGRVYPGARVYVMHKHDPRTLFAGFQQREKTPHRLVVPWLYRGYAATLGRGQENSLESADLVVFAGTPFLWRSSLRLFPFTSANAEWVGATWQRLFDEFPEKPVVYLSAGTSVTGPEQIEALLADRTVCGFLRGAMSRLQLTTARDRKTAEILSRLGFEVPVLPCASIFAARGAGLAPAPPEYAAINLMRSAAHSWRGQRGEPGRWRRVIEPVVAELAKRHRLQFISHSDEEDRTVAEWFPGYPRLVSKDPLLLLRAYGRARFGVCNRVHGAAAIASFGRPAMVIGGDSRWELIEQFGLPGFDHRSLEAATLIEAVRELEQKAERYAAGLARCAAEAEQAYLRLLCELRPSLPAAEAREQTLSR